MESACCFIGHRNIERASEVQEKLRKELRKLIEQGTTRFIFGDHSEFFTLCYDTVTELIQEYPQIKRVKFRKDYPEITESVKQYFFNGYEDNICPKGVAQSGMNCTPKVRHFGKRLSNAVRLFLFCGGIAKKPQKTNLSLYKSLCFFGKCVIIFSTVKVGCSCFPSKFCLNRG